MGGNKEGAWWTGEEWPSQRGEKNKKNTHRKIRNSMNRGVRAEK